MSGHSKWATTKHRKGAKDSARAKVFAKLIRQVEVAAREGGGDQSSNASLRTMFQKAREASVPIDTVSYTHLDVYKRQTHSASLGESRNKCSP